MNFIKDMKVGTKLVTLVGVLCLLLAAAVGYGLQLTQSINAEYKRIYTEDTSAAIKINAAAKAFTESRGSLTRWLFRVSPEERAKIAQEMESSDKRTDEMLQEISAQISNDDSKKQLSELRTKLANYRTARSALMQAQPAPGAPVDTLPELTPVHSLGGDIGQDINALTTEFATAGENDMQAVAAETSRAMTVSLVGAALLILLCLIVGIRIVRDMARRIEDMAGAITGIADGDLTASIDTSAGDEIGTMGRSLEAMRDNLHTAMAEIRMAADQVAAGARNVSDASVSLSQGAAEQASSVEQLSSSISEISSQTASNAENAGKANDLSQQAETQAKSGNDDMQHMLEAMEAINTSSQGISKIIKVIDEIAFQTNILALNAAVEAARAGVHGKGFAVVAEEVRNLAARSAKAAKETTEMIEDSIEKVGAGREIAQKTATALSTITGEVEQVAGLVSGIAKASSEQKLALEQIDQGVQQVSQVVQSNSSTSEEAASASEELSAQADRMKETASHFRLNLTSLNYRTQTDIKKPDLTAEPAAPAMHPHKTAHPKKIALTEDEGFGKY